MSPNFFHVCEHKTIEAKDNVVLYYETLQFDRIAAVTNTEKVDIPEFSIYRSIHSSEYGSWLCMLDSLTEEVQSYIQNIIKHAAFMGTMTINQDKQEKGFTNGLVDRMSSVLSCRGAGPITDILTETKIGNKDTFRPDLNIHDQLEWVKKGWWYGPDSSLAIGIDNSDNTVCLITKGFESNSDEVWLDFSIVLTDIKKVIMGVY